MREQLEADRGKDLKPSSQKSFADPDANMMKGADGALTYCYNAQAATSEDGVIVATGTTNRVRDIDQLVPMVDAVRKNTGRRPGVAVVDNGYLTEANLKEMKRRRQRCLVAVGREGKKPSSWDLSVRARRKRRSDFPGSEA